MTQKNGRRTKTAASAKAGVAMQERSMLRTQLAEAKHQLQLERSAHTRTRQNRGNAPKSFLGGIGSVVGDGVSKIFGLGAYRLSQNSLMKTGSQVPFMHSSNQNVTIRHREYITDVSSSTSAFAGTTYEINPGVTATFPWLATMAANFEEYKWKGLVFEYKTTSSDALNSTNTALGYVGMAAQYRASAFGNSIFSTKAQFLNEFWSTECKPSQNCILPIECSPKENPLSVLYVRTGGVPYPEDKKTYDLCQVTVAVGASQAVNVIGELWASYEVELYKPRISNIGKSLHLYSTAGITTTAIFGTNAGGVDSIGMTVSSTTGVITWPFSASPGHYLVAWSVAGYTNSTFSRPTVTATNCAIVTDLYGSGNTTAPADASLDATTSVAVYCIVNTAPSASYTQGAAPSIAFTGQSWTGTANLMDLVITMLDPHNPTY